MLSAGAMRAYRRLSASLLGGMTLVVALALGAGPSHATPEPGGTRGPAAVTATIDGEHYRIAVESDPAGPANVGSVGHLVVTIAAKEGYKVNKPYPTKLKMADPPPEGMEYPQKVLKRKDGEWVDGDKAFRFRAPFKPLRAGTFSVEGKLKFSVCNEDRCVIQKQTVKLAITAQ